MARTREDKLTKAELRDRLEQATALGNELTELLEGVVEDPVVEAYRKVLREHSRPFITSPMPDEPFYELQKRWDELIGRLQDEDLIDVPEPGAEVYVDYAEAPEE